LKTKGKLNMSVRAKEGTKAKALHAQYIQELKAMRTFDKLLIEIAENAISKVTRVPLLTRHTDMEISDFAIAKGEIALGIKERDRRGVITTQSKTKVADDTVMSRDFTVDMTKYSLRATELFSAAHDFIYLEEVTQGDVTAIIDKTYEVVKSTEDTTTKDDLLSFIAWVKVTYSPAKNTEQGAISATQATQTSDDIVILRQMMSTVTIEQITDKIKKCNG